MYFRGSAVPGSVSNPYLALTAILAAGLEGIEKALVLDEEAGDENAPRFPETLGILLQKLIRMNLHTVYLGKSSAGCTAREERGVGTLLCLCDGLGDSGISVSLLGGTKSQ